MLWFFNWVGHKSGHNFRCLKTLVPGRSLNTVVPKLQFGFPVSLGSAGATSNSPNFPAILPEQTPDSAMELSDLVALLEASERRWEEWRA